MLSLLGTWVPKNPTTRIVLPQSLLADMILSCFYKPPVYSLITNMLENKSVPMMYSHILIIIITDKYADTKAEYDALDSREFFLLFQSYLL
jgi:hypothetical protein